MNLRDLNGTRGVVYLMFVGRKTYAGAFQEKLVKVGLLKDQANVNQAVSFLLKEGFLKEVEEQADKPGKPRIRTANIAPLFETLKVCASKLSHDEVEEITFWVLSLGEVMDYFPDYLALRFKENSLLRLKALPWNYILGDFFFFCQFILGALVSEVEEQGFENARKLLDLKTLKNTIGAMMPLPEELQSLEKIAQNAVRALPQDKKQKMSNHLVSIRNNGKLELGILFSSLAFQLVVGRWHSVVHSVMKNAAMKITTTAFQKFLKENR